MSNPNLSLVILEQSAHCDWDWLQTFDGYFKTAYSGVGVRGILKSAINLVTTTTGYTYVFCEVSFLKKYFESNPPDLQNWRNAIAAGTFRFSSGGFTSAENLTLHTEAFIRNYLFGRWWLKNTLDATASLRMWVPDDFGHDAQLPVLLNALGYTGVGFWRIPVAGPEAPPSGEVQIQGSTYTVSASSIAPTSILIDPNNGPIGVDFIWQAMDGSTVQVHWLMNSYSEGNNDLGSDVTSPDVSGLDAAISGTTSYQGLSASGIAFVPIDNDFSLPYDNLPSALAGWQSDVPAQLGTFDDFLTQANSGLQTLLSNPSGGVNAFVPHPYYSGCYASHPELKILHYATIRTLLMAETAALLLAILGDSSQAQEAIANAWWAALPSTHHDYITGTAPNSIYDIEQIPDIQKAYALAIAAQQQVVGSIAAAIDVNSAGIGGTPFAVFNAISFPTLTSLVQITCDDPSQYTSSTIDGTTSYPVQPTTDGTGVLTLAPLQAMGYQTVWLTTASASETPSLTLTNNNDGTFTLENSRLKAVIGTTGILQLYDLVAGSGNLFPNADGNALVYYEDTGSIYRFANEVPWYGGTDGGNGSMTFQQVPFTSDLSIQEIENGLVRVTVQVSGTVTVNGEQPVNLSIAYSLVPNDPYLRIVTTSSAPGNTTGPTGYCVMVSFPFAPNANMTELAYGTTSHLDRRAPRQWFDWSPNAPSQFDFITFEPAHEFVVPYDSGGTILGAIYHANSPAWAISADGTSVLGCILRNTPNSAGNGASGWDVETHSLSYAVRVPSQLADPSEALAYNSPLVEALLLNNPPVVSAAIASTSSTLPAQLSIATTIDTNSIVTVAKLGTMDDTQLILRTYSTMNTSVQTNVQLAGELTKLFAIDNASAVTALEDAAANNVTIDGTSNGNTIVVTMNNAYATIAVPST